MNPALLEAAPLSRCCRSALSSSLKPTGKNPGVTVTPCWRRWSGGRGGQKCIRLHCSTARLCCSAGSPCISFPHCTTSFVFKGETSDQMLQTLRGQRKVLSGPTLQPLMQSTGLCPQHRMGHLETEVSRRNHHTSPLPKSVVGSLGLDQEGEDWQSEHLSLHCPSGRLLPRICILLLAA